MSNPIIWTPDTSNPDDEEKRQAIASWWTGLGGKRVEWYHVSGIQTDATGEEHVKKIGSQFLTIQNPRLGSNTLSFEGQGERHEIRFKRLELQGTQLKVFGTDPHRHVFTESSGGGSFRSEKVF